MTPAVAEARELGLPLARVVLDRELTDLEMLLGGPDHHLGGELHPRGPQVKPGQHVAPERPHPAMGVVDAGPEQQIQEARQQRVADVAVKPRHRPGVDVLHPVADHHVGAVVELGHEPGDLREVVGEVRVGHQDVAAPRDGESRHVGAPVAPLGLVHDERPRRGGEPGAGVLGVVVCHDDLALDGVLAQHVERAAHAALDRRLLIQARNDHRYRRCALPEGRTAGLGMLLLDRAHTQPGRQRSRPCTGTGPAPKSRS